MGRKGPAPPPHKAPNLSLFLHATFADCGCTSVEMRAVICLYERAHGASQVALVVCT